MNHNLNSLPYVFEERTDGEISTKCFHKDLESLCFFIRSNIEEMWLIDLFAVDKTASQSFLQLNYVYLNFENNEVLRIEVDYPKDTTLTSISHLFRNASVYEQELFELFGVQFDRPYSALLFSSRNKIKPLLKDELRKPKAKQASETLRDLSFSNAMFSRQLNFSLEMDEEKVKKCQLNSGYYHAGVEKLLENLSLKQSYFVIENVFPHHATEWSFLQSKNCEDALKMIVPERAQALRMILLEFSRISSHLVYIRDLMAYFENGSFYQQSLLWLKRIQSLFISYSGNEFLKNSIRIGGVIRDVNQAWLSRAIDDLIVIEKEMIFFQKFIFQNIEIKNALATHIIHKMNAYNFCLSGPLVRSCGVNIDLRKTDPFYFYNDVDFEIPIATKGTSFDLLCVKVEEVFQSIGIILQVLDNLPTGNCTHEDTVDLSNIEKTYQSKGDEKLSEELSHLYSFKDNFSNYSCIEGPNGLMNSYIQYKNQKIDRYRLFTNDSILKNVFEMVTQGRDVSEIELIWKIINPDIKQIER